MIVSAALTTLVLFGPGRRFFTLGVGSLLRGAPDMNALVALGAGAAYLYSLLATFAPNVLPEGARHSYFESAAIIVAFILLGRWLEARSRGRAADSIGKLARLQPKIAHVRRDGVDPRPCRSPRCSAGDVVEVRPGESVPVDGEVIEGASHVDESFISGESIPVAKKPGDSAIGGSVNLAGAFALRATKVGADTFLADVIRMVETAQGARLPIQDLADRVTARFVPVVLALALATFALWLAFGGMAGPAAGAGQRGQCADHRLSLRDGPRHARRAGDRHRPRGGTGRDFPSGRRAANPVRRQDGRLRQDRHADFGQAGADRNRRGRGLRRGAAAGARRRRRGAIGTSARPRSGRGGEGASGAGRRTGRAFRLSSRAWRDRRGRRRKGRRRARRTFWPRSASRPTTSPQRPRRLPGRAPPASSSRWTARRRACSPFPIRRAPRPPRRSRTCGRSACASP